LIAEGGLIGTVKVRFTERNALGVLDHDVALPSGATVHNRSAWSRTELAAT
jgi:hypothetical protein